MEWLRHLDSLLGQFPHVVSALEAIGTFAAVVTSLALALVAQRANRTRLEATACIGEIKGGTVQTEAPPRYLTVTISNMGLLPLRIPFAFFSFKIPLRRGCLAVLPLDAAGDAFLPKRIYPVLLQSRTKEWFSLTTERKLYDSLAEAWRNEPNWRKPLFRWMHAVVVTEDARRCKVNLPKDIRQKIAAIGGQR